MCGHIGAHYFRVYTGAVYDFRPHDGSTLRELTKIGNVLAVTKAAFSGTQEDFSHYQRAWFAWILIVGSFHVSRYKFH